MAKSILGRAEISALLLAKVNGIAPEKIEGADILPVVNPVANWNVGLIWPPVIQGGQTDAIIQEAIIDLQRDYDIFS